MSTPGSAPPSDTPLSVLTLPRRGAGSFAAALASAALTAAAVAAFVAAFAAAVEEVAEPVAFCTTSTAETLPGSGIATPVVVPEVSP